jgi:hypothetical protein
MIRAIIVPIANNNQPIHPHFGKHNNNKMTFCPQGRPRRIQRQQQSSSPAAPTTTLMQPPEETALDSSMEQMVLRTTNEYRSDSTSTIYDSKSKKYFQYCTSLYPQDPYAKVLSQYKVYHFLFYQSFQDQKKGGGKRDDRINGTRFVRSDYDAVMDKCKVGLNSSNGMAPPEPSKPVGKQTIDQYKAVLCWVYKNQTAQRVLGLVWDQICTLPCEQLHKGVKERRSAIKKLNYKEKLEAEFAPYTAVAQFDQIEDAMWKKGNPNI